MQDDPFLAILLDASENNKSRPLEVHVTLSKAEDVLALEDTIKALQIENKALLSRIPSTSVDMNAILVIQLRQKLAEARIRLKKAGLPYKWLDE